MGFAPAYLNTFEVLKKRFSIFNVEKILGYKTSALHDKYLLMKAQLTHEHGRVSKPRLSMRPA